MRAAVYHRYGPPEVVHIEDIPKPVLKDNEVLVRVHTTSVCAADWRLRKANPFFIRLFAGLWKPGKTPVLGMEFSGTVESVGKAVTRFHTGDQVFGGTGFTFGCHAEYVSLAEDGRLALKPANMTFEQGAAVLFGAFTALHFLKKANVHAGQRVLIYGASGSVGVFAVQLAKHFGAYVAAVCSTTNLELVKSLGADEVIDYTKQDFSQAGRVYDVVFDTVGRSGFARSLRCLKRGGTFVQVGFVNLRTALREALQARWASLTGAATTVSGTAKGTNADLAFFRELIEADKLHTVVDRCYPLAQIAEAHRLAEGGHKRGHVVVRVI